MGWPSAAPVPVDAGHPVWGGVVPPSPRVRVAQPLPHVLTSPPTASTGRYAPSRLVFRMMMAFTPGHSLSESEEERGHVRIARRVRTMVTIMVDVGNGGGEEAKEATRRSEPDGAFRTEEHRRSEGEEEGKRGC